LPPNDHGHPDFFAAVPCIRLRDPLAAFLGAAAGGVLEYGYVDVVKLAGHSCPTVASAYWLTRQALRALYGNDLPERGAVRVELAADIADGVAGVVANVASLLTARREFAASQVRRYEQLLKQRTASTGRGSPPDLAGSTR